MYPDEDEIMAWKENVKDAVLMAFLLPIMAVAFLVSIPPITIAATLWWWRGK